MSPGVQSFAFALSTAFSVLGSIVWGRCPRNQCGLWFFVGLVLGPILLVLWLWIIVRRVRRARAEREARADSVRAPRSGRQAYRCAMRTPVAGPGRENAGAGGAALSASRVRRQSPLADLMAVASDQRGPTRVAPGAAAFGVAHVACVHVTQAMPYCNLTRASESGQRCRWHITHLPVRMKRRKVQRHVRAKVFDEPSAHRF